MKYPSFCVRLLNKPLTRLLHRAAPCSRIGKLTRAKLLLVKQIDLAVHHGDVEIEININHVSSDERRRNHITIIVCHIFLQEHKYLEINLWPKKSDDRVITGPGPPTRFMDKRPRRYDIGPRRCSRPYTCPTAVWCAIGMNTYNIQPLSPPPGSSSA